MSCQDFLHEILNAIDQNETSVNLLNTHFQFLEDSWAATVHSHADLGSPQGARSSQLDEFTKLPMDYSWATQLATGPYMHAQESRTRDYRVATKETDDVLSLIRDQVYAFRRWIISADTQQLHSMLQTFCYVSRLSYSRERQQCTVKT